jgi:cellulose synthase/poly-beta-1,6-N-acetylglucosamine synthase-like glycosyltransferase
MAYIYAGLALLITLAYAGFTTYLQLGWRALPIWRVPENWQPRTRATVVIPARNESANIGACLEALLNQTLAPEYFDIIVVDDHSTDTTAAVVRRYADPRLQLLQAPEPAPGEVAFKKRALEHGIRAARGELIVCTDADCVAHPGWLASLLSYYEQHDYRMLAAPVALWKERNLVGIFQGLDMAGVMGTTGGGIQRGFMHSGNGANLAFERRSFEAIGGYGGIDQVASGDDMLLFQKMAHHHPGSVGFVKSAEAVVYTEPCHRWSDFIRQRIRWASKSSAYSEPWILAVLASVYLLCVGLFFTPLASWAFGWWGLAPGLFALSVKLLIDWRLLHELNHFFGRPDRLRYFLPAQPLHWLYLVWVGTLGNLPRRRYEWKGRRVV